MRLLVLLAGATVLPWAERAAGSTEPTAIRATVAAWLQLVPADFKITTGSLPNGTVGVPYSASIQVSDAKGKVTFGIVFGSVPPGLGLDTNGNLGGTPTTAGTFTFTVAATDKDGTVRANLSITIAGAPAPPLQITSGSLPGARVGISYSASLSASGGTPPYSWSLVSGSLPAGLSLSTSGQISGTPTAAGTSTFTLSVKDSGSGRASAAVTVSVAAAPASPPAVTTTSLPGGTVGAGYSATLGARGGSPPYTWSVTSGSLPPGISLNPSSGALSGTPQAAGDFTFTAQVIDSARATTSSGFTLHIGLNVLPTVFITDLPDTAAPLQQPHLGVALASGYGKGIGGQVVLIFQPDAANPADDPSIQFSTGGRTANFSIPANTTNAVFSVPQLALQTGSVSGTITVSVTLQSGGIDVTPNPAPSRSLKVARSAPVIRRVALVTTSSGVEVDVTAYSPPRDLTQAALHFNGSGLQTTDLTIPLADPARQWFRDAASQPYGSQFTLVLPFGVQGDRRAISSISVTLSNSQGTSALATANF